MDKANAWKLAMIEQNRSWLFSYALSSLGQPEAAEDLVPDVMLIAIRDIEKYDGSSPLGAWLRGIARNLVREYWRKKGKEPLVWSDAVMNELDQVSAESESAHCDTEYVFGRVQMVRECLRGLTSRVRALMEMKYFRNLKSSEIAGQMKMKVVAVDVALLRGRTAIFDCVRRKMREVSL